MNALVAVLVAVGGTGGFAAVAVALISRNKTNSDAEAASAVAKKTTNEAYLLLVKPLEDRMARQDLRIAELERRERIQDDLLTQHANWDRLATRALAEAGVVVGMAPPLYPQTGTN